MFKKINNLSKSAYAALFMLSLYPSKVFSDWDALNMREGVTQVSRDVFELHMLIFYICVAIGAVVFSVMFYSLFRYTKKRNPNPSTFHESTKLEVAWTVVPFLILIAMAVPASKTLTEIYDDEEGEINIQVVGYQWKWEYKYLEDDINFFSNLSTDQDEIYNLVPKGENYLLEVDEPLIIPVDTRVRFLITANDEYTHGGFQILQLNKMQFLGLLTQHGLEQKKQAFTGVIAQNFVERIMALCQ